LVKYYFRFIELNKLLRWLELGKKGCFGEAFLGFRRGTASLNPRSAGVLGEGLGFLGRVGSHWGSRYILKAVLEGRPRSATTDAEK